VSDRRRRRGWIVVLVAVLAVAGLVVIADRGVQAVAENQIATQLQTDLGTAEKPAVDLGPFPFLHEIATGRVASAQVHLSEVELPDSNGATATGVDATFADITISDQFSRIVAGSGEATGLLSYPSLSALTGLELSYAGTDRVQVSFELPLGEETVSGTATGRPVLNVENQTLEIADAEVAVGSTEGDEAAVEAAGRLLLRSLPLRGLPYELRLTALTVREDGVQVTAAGRDLPLRG
jgi:hypothetical protein